MNEDRDWQVRLAAFQWLSAQVELHGDVLDRALLEQGFEHQGERVPLLGPQGIFKPRVMRDAPLSITTVPSGPYDDSLSGGVLRYAYRGTDTNHPNNRGLRDAMVRRLPLVYFYRLVPGKYLVAHPVFVVGDRPKELMFDVQVDDVAVEAKSGLLAAEDPEDRAAVRRYVTTLVRRRVHQEAFRLRVIAAYRQQCAFCRLRHEGLLDAAHITADSEEQGEPLVSNGLALCKLHHAAYDQQFLTVRPDYVIEVRQSVLDEEDGPMLRHGLQGMHMQSIVLPKSVTLQPDRDRLNARYEFFRSLQ